MIKSLTFTFFVLTLFCLPLQLFSALPEKNTADTVILPLDIIGADNVNIRYTGRIDFSDLKNPRFSAPGVYIQAWFSGTYIDLAITDQYLYGKNLNYIEVVIDNQAPIRFKLDNHKTIYPLAKGLSPGKHSVLVCKDSESSIGWLIFKGFRCEKLLTPPARPTRKIECYGNSITCGAGEQTDLCTEATGDHWYISNKAYMSYGALTARNLNADWQLTSYSGIGLVKSCCGLTITMPDIYDHLFLENPASPKWDFTKYIPDVVTIGLGQNDGIMDSAVFCSRYVQFIESIRHQYPKAAIICITSPMSDDPLLEYQKKSLGAIVTYMNIQEKDTNIYKVFLTNKMNNGCTNHPDEKQHYRIADEMEKAIRKIMNWQ